MSQLIVTQAQIDSLEYQTEQAHRALKKAIRTREPLNLTWARDLYRAFNYSMYQVDGDWLVQNRNSAKSRRLERYLLQGSLSHGFLLDDVGWTLPQQTFSPPERHKILYNIKRIIDLRENNSYSNIADAARQLGIERRFDVLLDAISYVRLHYTKPSLTNT